MQLSDFEHFRDLLIERRQNLMDWLNSSAFLQSQDADKVESLLVDIKEALSKIKEGSYGQCVECCGSVELHQLEIQPVAHVCIECFSDEQKAQLEQDLYLASKIHRALLPQSVPRIDGFEVAVQSMAARQIGGDFYDFLESNGNSSPRVVIADIMGKGLPAGLLLSNLQGALRILSSEIDSPGPLITRLNHWLCRNIPVTKFVSLVCLYLEKTSDSKSRLVYTNAGHPAPILIRKNGKAEKLDVTGGVIGVHEDFAYEEKSKFMSSGDFLVLYTDGVTEAENARGELYEEDRLIAFLKNNRTEPSKTILQNLLAEVQDYSSSVEEGDDLTVIVLRKK